MHFFVKKAEFDFNISSKVCFSVLFILVSILLVLYPHLRCLFFEFLFNLMEWKSSLVILIVEIAYALEELS